MKNTTMLKLFISCGGLLIFIARLIWPTIKIDAISLGLIIVAILPWLSSLIESAEFPGGWKIKFRDIERAGAKIIAEEEMPTTTTTSTSTTSTTTTTLPPEAFEKPSNISFLEVREVDPNLALVGFRIEIEKRIRKLAEIIGLRANQPLSKLLRELNQRGVLSQMVFSGLQYIISAGNQAAHGAKVEPSVTDWAFDIGADILSVLDKKIDDYSN